TVALVARREFDARVRTRSYLIGLLVTALILAGILVVPALLADRTTKLGLVAGTTLASGPQVTQLEAAAWRADVRLDVSTLPDEPAARAAVQRGDLNAALIRQGDRYELLVESDINAQVRAVVDGVVAQQGIEAALAQRGVDPRLLTEAAPPVTL